MDRSVLGSDITALPDVFVIEYVIEDDLQIMTR